MFIRKSEWEDVQLEIKALKNRLERLEEEQIKRCEIKDMIKDEVKFVFRWNAYEVVFENYKDKIIGIIRKRWQDATDKINVLDNIDVTEL